MLQKFLISCAFFAISLNAQAGLFDDDEARKAILDLRGKVEVQKAEQDKKIADISTRLGDISNRLEQLDQTTKGILQLNNQLELLRGEINKLRGQIEVQSNDTSNLQKDLSTLQKDVAGVQKNQRDSTTELAARIKTVEPVAVQIDGKQVNVEAAEKRRFDAALGLVRSGDFRGALGSLQQFQVAYPDSPYAPSVAYWIGTCHYGLKDYKSSVAAMQAVISSQPPDSPRVPDAYFTLGMSQIESNDRRGGRKTLETFIDRFPNAALVSAAKERLATLKP